MRRLDFEMALEDAPLLPGDEIVYEPGDEVLKFFRRGRLLRLYYEGIGWKESFGLPAMPFSWPSGRTERRGLLVPLHWVLNVIATGAGVDIFERETNHRTGKVEFVAKERPKY